RFDIKLLEYLAELNGRIDIELLSSQTKDLPGQPAQLTFDLDPCFVKLGDVHSHPDLLHLEKDLDQRQLYLRIDLFQVEPGQLGPERAGKLVRKVRRLQRPRVVRIKPFNLRSQLDAQVLSRDFRHPVVSPVG